MKQARPFVVTALISGLITVVPIYLAVLLLLKLAWGGPWRRPTAWGARG